MSFYFKKYHLLFIKFWIEFTKKKKKNVIDWNMLIAELFKNNKNNTTAEKLILKTQHCKNIQHNFISYVINIIK